jgi:hypothetical protein
MDDCAFCAIVAGQAPAHRLLEDEHTVSFQNIAPTGCGIWPPPYGTGCCGTATDAPGNEVIVQVGYVEIQAWARRFPGRDPPLSPFRDGTGWRGIC